MCIPFSSAEHTTDVTSALFHIYIILQAEHNNEVVTYALRQLPSVLCNVQL